MTTPRLLVLRTLLSEPGRERYGLDLAREAGLEPGTIYPILVAFERVGWVGSREEEIDARVEGRPRRRYYRLTAAGESAARDAARAANRRRSTRQSAPASERPAW